MPTDLLATFKKRFSEARLDPYEVAAHDDPELTVALYDWNIQIGSAFFEDIGIVEVLLRNALDKTLREQYQSHPDSEPWYHQNGVLLQAQGAAVDEAIKHLDDEYGDPEQDDVIAALSFGLWRSLFTPGYQRLWPTLKEAFVYLPPRVSIRQADMCDHVSDLHELRNGIAHHDPIFNWNFEASVTNLKRVAEPICPKTYGWMNQRSRVRDLLAADPRRAERS
jgi:hypothetical protein